MPKDYEMRDGETYEQWAKRLRDAYGTQGPYIIEQV